MEGVPNRASAAALVTRLDVGAAKGALEAIMGQRPDVLLPYVYGTHDEHNVLCNLCSSLGFPVSGSTPSSGAGAMDGSCSRLVPYFTVLAECSYYMSKKYYDSIYLLTAP